MSPTIKKIRTEIRRHADRKRALALSGFFKTGPGEYGEGDLFLGIKVPVLRKIAKTFRDSPSTVVEGLIRSPYHEERLVALVIWVLQYQRATETERRRIYRLYVKNIRWINNWDLVDLTAPHIVGGELNAGRIIPLDRWVTSSNLWHRRIAMLGAFGPIRQGHFDLALKLAKQLLGDREDLIHKAVGWMLREIGKQDLEAEEAFLRRHFKTMPRTMLRYAIERFPEKKRLEYLGRKA